MSLVYKFTVPAIAAGEPYIIQDDADTTVASGTVGSDETDGLIVVQATLPEGTYSIDAAKSTWLGSFQRNGIVDLPASIAAGGGGGSTETAYFIGTGSGATDGSENALTFVQDPTHDAVDWAAVDEDGNIALPGPISVGMIYRYHAGLDFTGATGFSTEHSGPDTDVTVKVSRYSGDGFGVNAGGPFAFVATGASGETFDIDAVEEGITQNTRASANEQMVIKATANANGYDVDGASVGDGTFNAALALWVTKLPLPPLPDFS